MCPSSSNLVKCEPATCHVQACNVVGRRDQHPLRALLGYHPRCCRQFEGKDRTARDRRAAGLCAIVLKYSGASVRVRFALAWLRPPETDEPGVWVGYPKCQDGDGFATLARQQDWARTPSRTGVSRECLRRRRPILTNISLPLLGRLCDKARELPVAARSAVTGSECVL